MTTSAQPSDRSLTAEGTHSGAFTSLDWGLLLAPAAIWGSSFALIAVALPAFPPTVLTVLRIAFGFLALTLVPARRTRVSREDWPRVALVGVLWMAVPLSLFSFAIVHVPSATAGMVNGATPIAALVVASLALRRWPGRWQLAGILVGFVGIVLVSVPDLGQGGGNALGVLMLLVAVSCYGVAINLAVPLQQRYGAVSVFWRAQAVALVLTAPLALVDLDAVDPTVGAWVAVAALGALGTGLAFVLAGTLAGRVGGARASVITYLIPPWSIALGVLALGESVAAIALVGSAVVLLGAFLASRRDDRAPAEIVAAADGDEGPGRSATVD